MIILFWHNHSSNHIKDYSSTNSGTGLQHLARCSIKSLIPWIITPFLCLIFIGEVEFLLGCFSEEDCWPATPAVGFGIGEERLMLVLQKQNPDLFRDQGIDFFITNIGAGTEMKTVEIARSLRAQGFKTQYDVDQKKLKAQFRKADRVGAKYVITLGAKELENGTLNIKRLADGKTIDLSLDDVNDMQTVMKRLKD